MTETLDAAGGGAPRGRAVPRRNQPIGAGGRAPCAPSSGARHHRRLRVRRRPEPAAGVEAPAVTIGAWAASASCTGGGGLQLPAAREYRGVALRLNEADATRSGGAGGRGVAAAQSSDAESRAVSRVAGRGARLGRARPAGGSGRTVWPRPRGRDGCRPDRRYNEMAPRTPVAVETRRSRTLRRVLVLVQRQFGLPAQGHIKSKVREDRRPPARILLRERKGSERVGGARARDLRSCARAERAELPPGQEGVDASGTRLHASQGGLDRSHPQTSSRT